MDAAPETLPGCDINASIGEYFGARLTKMILTFCFIKSNDYDLCHNCMINGVTSKQHLTSHPMKSIIAQGDLDLYFGESLRKKERVHDEDDEDEEEYEEEVPEEEEDDEDQISPRDVLGTGEKTYACPYCARIGYTDELLVNHVGT